MNDELTARHRAITLRLAGRPVSGICAAVGRSKVWFHKWWNRYLEAGPEGLYDLTRANHNVAQHLSPELERTILSIRRRLQLARQLIQAASGPLDWSRYRDSSAEELAALVQAKVANQACPPATAEPIAILQLLDALKQSVAATSATASAAPAAPSRVRPTRSSLRPQS